MTQKASRVAVLEKVRIGGADLWMSVRSDDLRNPMVLYVHGGPGAAQLSSNRRHTRELERHFTVVDWDQRGAGKSYAAIKDADRMNIGQFVEDTRELTSLLLKRYHQDRVVLVGHSWGSAIGAMTAAKYRELFHSYVGIGQVANMAEGEAASYRWTLEEAQRRHNRRAIRVLTTIGPPPYTGDWQRKTIVERQYVARFGGEVHGSAFGAMGVVVRSLVMSREYDLVDRLNLFRGLLGSMKLLWPQLLQVNLFESVPELQLPVFIVAGRFDHEVPAEVSAKYFAALRAPSKELVWFERSAHMPQFEEPQLFSRMMVEKVLPSTKRPAGGQSAGAPPIASIRSPGP